MGTREMDIKIRKMTEADLPRIKEIDRELVGLYRAASWPLRVEAHWWVYRGMPNFVAEIGNQLVGFLLGDIRGSEYGTDVSGWIDIMGVAPEYQSKGIGRKLVEAFCKECQKQGIRVRILVVGDDQRLVRFWTSLGFQKSNLISYQRDSCSV